MPRQDDPSITGELKLYRRIPPDGDRVSWDDFGQPIPSSFNFNDAEKEMSMNIADETTPEAVLAIAPRKGFGIVYLTAGQIREVCGGDVVICRDDKDPSNGHVLICGNITAGKRKRLSKLAQSQWVVLPDRSS